MDWGVNMKTGSATSGYLVVPRSGTKQADNAFSHYAPHRNREMKPPDSCTIIAIIIVFIDIIIIIIVVFFLFNFML